MPGEALPRGWERRRLIETAVPGREGFDDGDWIESPYIETAGIRLIQTGNIGLGEFLDKSGTKKFISEHSFKVLRCKWVYPGDILICRLADPIGRACLVPPHVGNSITSVDCTIYRPDPTSTDAGYVLHRLNWVRHLKEAADIAGGSTRQRISRSNLGALVVPLPALPEQRRIAEILDTVDEAIRKTEQVIAKLQQMKQGLLHDLLTRGIDENGELRDPERHPEQFQDSPLGRIPKAWQVQRVGSQLDRIEQGWSPDCFSWPAATGDWGVLRTTAVVWSGYNDAENKALPPQLAPRTEYEVHPTDVLMTRAGPNSRVGVVAMVEETQGRLMLSDKLYRLVPKPASLLPAFLVRALSGQQTQRHLSTLKTGLAESQTNISQSIVRALWLPVPSLDEQGHVCTTYTAHVDRMLGEGAQLAKLCSLKHGLMDDLLTGRVRVLKPEQANT